MSGQGSLPTDRRRFDREAPIYDPSVALGERLLMRRLRARLWGELPSEGRLLEVGVGTGRNVPNYPTGVELIATDFSGAMLRRAIARARRNGTRVAFAVMDAQRLALADESVDGALATFVFCSLRDPDEGLREMLRVLRPGARAVFLEHMRSTNPVLGTVMRWLDRPFRWVVGEGVHSPALGCLGESGFRVVSVRGFFAGVVRMIVVEKPDRAA